MRTGFKKVLTIVMIFMMIVSFGSLGSVNVRAENNYNADSEFQGEQINNNENFNPEVVNSEEKQEEETTSENSTEKVAEEEIINASKTQNDGDIQTKEKADYTFDENTGTLTYTGTEFDRDILQNDDLKDKVIEVIILDNSEMITKEPTYINTINSVKKIVVKNAKIISKNTFNGFEGVTEIEISNAETLNALSFVCISAETITIKDVKTVEKNSFQGTFALTNLAVDGVENFEEAFVNVGNITATATLSNITNLKGLGSKFKDLTLNNIDTIYSKAFTFNSKLETLTLNNVKNIEELAFWYSYALKTLNINGEDTVIGKNAFNLCLALENVNITNCKVIEGGAFDDCIKLKTINIPDNVRLGYSTVFAGIPELAIRMQKIMADKFSLNAAKGQADELTVDNSFSSIKIGIDNATEVPGTQLTKSAKWSDDEKTTADVELQFSYAQKQGIDFLFVVDYSASMAMLGDNDAEDSRYYQLQSKVLDVSNKLLTTDGYDNRVGVITFGGYSSKSVPGKFETIDFTNNSNQISQDFQSIVHSGQNQNTDYITALQKAKQLINNRDDDSREVAIIFISDGAPTVDKENGLYVPPDVDLTYGKKGHIGDDNWYLMLNYIKEEADAIKETGAKIYGVTQSVPENEEIYCSDAMEAVCTEGLIFTSKDTEGFSKAVNDAIGSAYSVHVLEDVVDPNFELDESSIEINNGIYELSTNDEGNTVITWTIYGTPYETYKLSYKAKLNQVDEAYPFGIFDTNEGNAVLTKEGITVNTVETPQLSRTSYIVEHKYYTKTDDGEYILDNIVSVKSEGVFSIGDIISADNIEHIFTNQDNIYSFYKNNGDIILKEDQDENKITIEYRREVKTPVKDNENEEEDGEENKEEVKEEVKGIEVQTSDTTNYMIYIVPSMLAIGGILFLRKR